MLEEEKQGLSPEEITEEEIGPEKAKREGHELFEWLQAMAASVLVVVLLFTFGFRITGVEGSSMVPTLQDGDRLLVIADLWCSYEPGDIVIAHKDSFYPEPIVKRVIAVEGQTVDIDFTFGVVYVDGVALDEPYINTPTTSNEGTVFPLTVAEGHVFLMGDNRNGSSDSRHILLGQVDEDYLMGKAVLLLFPGTGEYSDTRDYGRIGLLK